MTRWLYGRMWLECSVLRQGCLPMKHQNTFSSEAVKLLQEASATMECRCIMDYVISHNADGVREFRRVSEAETRLVSVVALVMLFDPACFPPNLCVDSDFVLTGCGTLEDWCTCGSFWNQKVVIEHPRCSFVTMGSRAGRVLGRVSEAKPGKSFSLKKHWDDFEILLKHIETVLFLPASFDILHYSSHPLFLWHMSSINEYLRYRYIYFERATSPQEMMNTPRHANAPHQASSWRSSTRGNFRTTWSCPGGWFVGWGLLCTGQPVTWLASHDWLPVAAKLRFSTIQYWWNWRLEIMVYIASGLKCSWVWSVLKILDIQQKDRCCPWSSSSRSRKGGQEMTRANKRYVGRDAEIFMGRKWTWAEQSGGLFASGWVRFQATLLVADSSCFFPDFSLVFFPGSWWSWCECDACCAFGALGLMHCSWAAIWWGSAGAPQHLQLLWTAQRSVWGIVRGAWTRRQLESCAEIRGCWSHMKIENPGMNWMNMGIFELPWIVWKHWSNLAIAALWSSWACIADLCGAGHTFCKEVKKAGQMEW